MGDNTDLILEGVLADLILEGVLCQECGEEIGGEPRGFPRSCPHCQRTIRRADRAQKRNAKPYKCPECGKRLRTEQGRDDHRRDKHGIANQTD